MFEFKPDLQDVVNRFEAWWDCDIIDRPLASIRFPKPVSEQTALPKKRHATIRDRWMDTEYRVEEIVARLYNTVHYADALPIGWPNLGPEIFPAFYGCPIHYGETTAWSEPILHDWRPESVEKLCLDTDGIYFRKIMEMTDALIEAGKNRFIVGYTDLHPGGDCLAAFRDPQELCVDLIEHPAEVSALCTRVTDDFLRVYDIFYDKLSAAGMPSTTWLAATCRGRYHVPSNDFSCMISDEMFESIFLPELVRECRHMDRCIYHLDGPQALRYLDVLLDIPEIHAIQWVPGAGHNYWADWIDIYKRIQAAGKAIQINNVPVSELASVFEVLRPEGVWLNNVTGIENKNEAEAALKVIERRGH